MTPPGELVRLWREANGLQADGDFAFFFDAYGDAEAEVGPEVATAWQACRRRTRQGLAASVKDLMEKERVPVVLAPAQPKGGPSAKGSAPVPSAVIPRFKPTLEPPVSPKEPVSCIAEACCPASYWFEAWPRRDPG